MISRRRHGGGALGIFLAVAVIGASTALAPSDARVPNAKFLSDAVILQERGALGLVSTTLQSSPLPATLAQDSQECGVLALPVRFELASRPPTTLDLLGTWESPDGATFATWSQDLAGIHRHPAVFSAGVKVAFRMQEMSSITKNDGAVAVALHDCAGALMYELWVHPKELDVYEIYTPRGELLARSSTSEHVGAGSMVFSDVRGKPIAFAQSPMILHEPGTDLYGGAGVEDAEGERAAAAEHQEPGFVQPWQVWFLPQEVHSSPLGEAQHRWVIAAAVQDRALREAMAILVANRSTWVSVLLAVAPVLPAAGVFVAGALLVYLVCRTLWTMVYPFQGTATIGTNPFLRPIIYDNRSFEHENLVKGNERIGRYVPPGGHRKELHDSAGLPHRATSKQERFLGYGSATLA